MFTGAIPDEIGNLEKLGKSRVRKENICCDGSQLNPLFCSEILFLHDNSRSAGIAIGNDSAAYRNNIEKLATQLGGKFRVVQWGFGDGVQDDSFFRYDRQATDISAALSRAEEFYGMQNLGETVSRDAVGGRHLHASDPASGPFSYSIMQNWK